MGLIDLELFRRHVRAEDSYIEDALLEHYLAVGETEAINYTGRTAEELTEMGGGRLPLPLVQAALMLGAHYYNQREGVSGVQMHSVPHGILGLLKPYRKLTDYVEESNDTKDSGDDSREDDE